MQDRNKVHICNKKKLEYCREKRDFKSLDVFTTLSTFPEEVSSPLSKS